MTIKDIRKMADWKRVLNARSVYANTTVASNPLRIVGVGSKYVRVLLRGGAENILPEAITSIQGL